MRFLFIFILLFSSVFSTTQYSGQEDSYQFQIKQVFSWQKNLIVVENNNSLWELFCFNLRSRTWSEWWNNIEVKVQDNFIWNNNSWQPGDTLEISKNNLSESIVEKIDKDDREEYSKYHYLIKNSNSSKIAFARAITFEELVNKLTAYAKQQFNAGYDSGYSKGYSYGSDSGYNLGYKAGYSAGSSAGYNKGSSVEYNKGYEAGSSAGYNKGYEAGYKAGIDYENNPGSLPPYNPAYTNTVNR